MSTWERGTREGPPLSFAGFSEPGEGRRAAGPLGSQVAFSSFVMQALRLAPCAVEGAVPAVEVLLAELCG